MNSFSLVFRSTTERLRSFLENFYYKVKLIRTRKDKPDFIRKPFPAKTVYTMWLNHIKVIEKLTMTDHDNYDLSMSIGYLLFPLIDAISFTLFNKPGRTYLEKLGIKKSYLIYKIFRNGQLHNIDNYILRYDDGEVGWGMGSGGGTGGIRPYDPGYKDDKYPEVNQPPEVVFNYIKLSNGTIHASLHLDRLAALVRYDLEQRMKLDQNDNINLIVGQKFKGKMPEPDDEETKL